MVWFGGTSPADMAPSPYPPRRGEDRARAPPVFTVPQSDAEKAPWTDCRDARSLR